LQEGGSQGGVRIGRVGQQHTQISLGLDPLIEPPGGRDGDAHPPAVAVLGEVNRIDHRIHDIAEQVPERGRTDHGNEEVGTRPDAIVTQGVAEGTQVMGLPHFGRDVDHAAEAQRGVVGETHGRQAGAAGPELEHVVDHYARLAEIDQYMVDGVADRPRRKLAIDKSEGADGVFVEGLLNGEALAVEPLERIVGRAGGRRGEARTGERDERQRSGDDPGSHG
jgi:hypothetical protein